MVDRDLQIVVGAKLDDLQSVGIAGTQERDMPEAKNDPSPAEAEAEQVKTPKGPTVAQRLDRIEKVLGIGMSSDEAAAERSERRDEMVRAKMAAQEAERKRLLRASAA